LTENDRVESQCSFSIFARIPNRIFSSYRPTHTRTQTEKTMSRGTSAEASVFRLTCCENRFTL
jgi:hypothetical protein